jgi:tRNA(Ile)-lysidine synthase
LLALARSARLDVTAIHVDHGLRPGSHEEADAVARAADDVGAAFVSHRVHVEPGPNLEARARAARYAVLPEDVSTGHTADDRAETVIINLLRGAGLDGLAGMRRLGGPTGRILHPLLDIRRRETIEVCSRLGWIPFEDPTNTDRTLLRNRIRLDLLPSMNEAAGRDLVPILVRQAELLADEADALDDLGSLIDPTDARALAHAPIAIARRAVRRWLEGVHPPDSATVERVLAVARGDAIACELPGGIRISRTNQRMSMNLPEIHD